MWPTPPPCPVDDAPHTTCTSPDYVPSASIVVVQLPCRDAGILATRLPVAPPTPETPDAPPTAFTTKSYRRGQLKGRV